MGTNLLAWTEEGNRLYTQKHSCSAALSEAALCSARHVQCPLSIASVKLAAGWHSLFHHFYCRESWKMLPSPELLDGQLKAWEYILTLLKLVAGLPQISAMPRLHLLRARRGRAMNCNNTEQSLCAFWWKRVRNQSREHPKHPEWRLLRWEMRFSAWPALQWVLGGCSEFESIGFLTRPHMEDSLLILKICLNVFYFSNTDAAETGVAQLFLVCWSQQFITLSRLIYLDSCMFIYHGLSLNDGNW